MNEQEFQILSREYPQARAVVEFVSGSYRNTGFWRFKRDRTKPLTVAEMKHRLAFIRANFEVYGEKGLKPLDGLAMPPACSKLRERLKGKTFTGQTSSERRLSLARKRLEKVSPRLSQREISKQWEQFEKKWDYWKKRAEYDMRTVKVWRPQVVQR